MRLAILSDIHGNTLALDAVLADIQAQGGVDGYWLLGDYAAIGPDPVGVLERLATLPNATFIRGNTDRYNAYGELPSEWLTTLVNSLNQQSKILEINGSLGWTQGVLTQTGWLNWMRGLPLDQRLTLPDGTRVLLVHCSPGADDGDGVHPGVNDDVLAQRMVGCEADLVFVGHTHWYADRRAGAIRVVNPGSISNPFPPDLRASYIVLTADAQGYQLENRRVDYDHQAIIDTLEHQRHPGAPYIINFMRGQAKGKWMK